MGALSLAILLLAVVAGLFPTVFGVFVAIVAGWIGLITVIRALTQARRARKEEEEAARRQSAALDERVEIEPAALERSADREGS